MRMVLEECKAMGVMSASNIGPSISYVDKGSNIRRVLESAGVTLQHEIEMLKLAREMDMVSIGLAFDEEDSCAMVEQAQPDIFCFHAGTTKGGRKGFDSGETIEQTAARTESANQKLRKLKKDIIGSSTERLPIERAVLETAKTFAALSFGGRGKSARK
jgi:predicted TIM-barrel enzyme